MSLWNASKKNPTGIVLFIFGQCKWLLNIYMEKMIDNNRIKQSSECLELTNSKSTGIFTEPKLNGTPETQLTNQMVCITLQKSTEA